ncbi:hypothetical protein B566_EDAN007155 [Ephemera danica]|nr:hypothetical protein B566_EDAN007155 [Ephemera danica]
MDEQPSQSSKEQQSSEVESCDTDHKEKLYRAMKSLIRNRKAYVSRCAANTREILDMRLKVILGAKVIEKKGGPASAINNKDIALDLPSDENEEEPDFSTEPLPDSIESFMSETQDKQSDLDVVQKVMQQIHRETTSQFFKMMAEH